MQRFFLAMVTLATLTGMTVPVSAQTVGVVLMHGNTDSPSGTIAPLAAALEGAGYLVERPEMCWSGRRRRDRSLLDCLAELEAPIGRLSGRGVHAIVVAGMSVGGLAALAFGARREGLAGIVALAASGSPEHAVRLYPQIAQSVAEAQAMVASGRGDDRASFTDANIRGPFSINTTAAIYLSFYDPTGPANIPDNTSRLRAPLLWVAGTLDRSQAGPGYAFSRAPANPQNRYVTVDSDHLGTPAASREAVLVWLSGLR
jgi:pimeloyl-ACP methyl ester carboxylesterase